MLQFGVTNFENLKFRHWQVYVRTRTQRVEALPSINIWDENNKVWYTLQVNITEDKKQSKIPVFYGWLDIAFYGFSRVVFWGRKMFFKEPNLNSFSFQKSNHMKKPIRFSVMTFWNRLRQRVEWVTRVPFYGSWECSNTKWKIPVSPKFWSKWTKE